LLSNKVHNHFLVLFLDVNFFTTFSQLDNARILGRNLDTLWGCICQKNFEFFMYFFVFISICCFFRSFFIFFRGNKNRHRFLSFTTLKSDDIALWLIVDVSHSIFMAIRIIREEGFCTNRAAVLTITSIKPPDNDFNLILTLI